MTYKDLKVIDSSWIDERIVDLQAALLGVTMTDETVRYSVIDAKIKLLEAIKLQMLDATPILTNCIEFGRGQILEQIAIGDIENDTEQFLNKEIKLLNNE